MHWGEVLLRRNQEIEVSSFEILASGLTWVHLAAPSANEASALSTRFG